MRASTFRPTTRYAIDFPALLFGVRGDTSGLAQRSLTLGMVEGPPLALGTMWSS